MELDGERPELAHQLGIEIHANLAVENLDEAEPVEQIALGMESRETLCSVLDSLI